MSGSILGLIDEQLSKENDYWLQKLSGDLIVTGVPLDLPRPTSFSNEKETIELEIDGYIAGRLFTVCDNKDHLVLTLFVTALSICLHKYTGVEDIIVGTAIHEQYGRFSLLNKVLVLRNQVCGAATLRQILESVRLTISEAYTNQKYPFNRILDLISIENPTNRAPLFNAVVIFDSINNPENVKDLRNDVTLLLSRRGQAITCTIEFNSGLFRRETIELFGEHYKKILCSVLDCPAMVVSQLELLSEVKRQQFVFEFNNTESAYPKGKFIHQLFEEQAVATPDATAIEFEDLRLTYRELNYQANQLAHYLEAVGVKPGARIAIYLEHSLNTIVGILAILKAGGAYVPLDPEHPNARLRFMLTDAQVPVILTEERLASQLLDCGAKLICLDSDWEAVEPQPGDNPVAKANQRNVAYVIYTSGSTGQPKGVEIMHASLVNYIWWAKEVYLRNESLAFPLYSSLAFDLTVTSIFTPLITGNRVIAFRGDEKESLLSKILEDNRVGVLKLTPSHLSLIVDKDNSQSGVKRLIVGGEALETKLASQAYKSFGGHVEIFNEYGPTEATVGCMIYEFDPAKDNRAFVPIGRPAANSQVYILDERLNPVAENVAGELYISGDGLAGGYLNSQELTAERFIENTFLPGKRMYKTGDLARRLPDGVLEYLGRADDQVKFHGFRVELSEIRSALNRHPQIRDSVVVVTRDKNSHDVMVAYYVSRHEQKSEHLRAFLSESLIEETIPNVFVHLKKLPLTLNGKINHRALPTLEEARAKSQQPYVAPRNATETVLVNIWLQLLGVKQVGIYDNFFELGGDSILSIRIIARAKQAGLHLDPKQLFQHQTIAELAAVAGSVPTTQAEQDVVTGPVSLTSIQRWFFNQSLPDLHHYNHALMFEVKQQLDPSLVEAVVQNLLLHHDALRLRFVQTGAEWQQRNASTDDSIPFTSVDLSGLSEAEQLIALEAKAAELQSGLNLSEGPLLRVALFDLGPQKPGRLLIVIHHLAVDGISWRILLEDFERAYRQAAQGEAIQLLPKTTSFKRWARQLTVFAQSAQLRRELDHWRLKSKEPLFRLPVDAAEGENTEESVRSVSVALSVEETRVLLREVPKAYNTEINDALLTALVIALNESTDTRSQLIDLEGHGRVALFDGVDLTRTVGWFTSIFPVLIDLGEAGGPEEALKLVKEQLRRIPNHGIGYGLLRYICEDAGVAEELASFPQAEVSFNYLGQFDQDLSESSFFALANESCGPSRALSGRRHYLLEINASVMEGQLQVAWAYSENLHSGSRVERLALRFMDVLRSLISHCASSETKGYTPSDFPEAGLNQNELDEIIAQLGPIS